jgi:hypothetical protein
VEGGHKGHASLKFEKDGSLAKCASGAPKSIADKKVQKSAWGVKIGKTHPASSFIPLWRIPPQLTPRSILLLFMSR